MGMSIGQYKDSDKIYSQMDKNAQSYNPDDIMKGFENAMNLTPEMLKNSGMNPEQIKQMTEGLIKFKKEMNSGKINTFKDALGKIKKEDLIKANEGLKLRDNSLPKSDDIIHDFESLVPYGKLPSKFGECEDMEI
jgi:uncharacterized protein YydD (DUF2326 family)